jgi:WD40 repeat protein
MLQLKGHEDGATIYSLSFSPDGSKLASGADDRTVRLWDLPAGNNQVLAQCTGPRRSRAVSFSPDGAWLAWSGEGVLTVRDLRAGMTQVLAISEEDEFRCLQFSPDGKVLAVGGSDLQVWDVPAWKPLSVQLPGEVEEVNRLAFASGGEKWLAAAVTLAGPRTSSRRFLIYLLDPISGAVHHQFHAGTQRLTSLSFSPDGRLLAGTYGATYEVWDVAGEVGELVHGLKIFHREFYAAAFTPDSRFLAVSRSDLTLRFLDVATWRERMAFRWKVGRIHALAFSPDGMKGAGGANKGVIAVWDMDL